MIKIIKSIKNHIFEKIDIIEFFNEKKMLQSQIVSYLELIHDYSNQVNILKKENEKLKEINKKLILTYFAKSHRSDNPNK